MKSKKEKANTGTFSVEHLYHFRCGTCNKWWSIGDPKIAANITKREWFCPWCGIAQKFKLLR